MTQGSNDGGPVDRAHTPGLLPCPFCGEPPYVYFNDDIINIECQTVNCPASPISSGDLIVDAHKALEAWNTRALASPDLLDVAESVVAWADDEMITFTASGMVCILPKFVATARAAIAKAKGVTE